ncbi:3-deoxy-manno-octulosonate cytidylyltransferase [bacterium]|jgi:3-deoxy-manno-octulosonate cytidylyltransferase (CMP-KDO synthetase)|nr:3-deoxy-manno-octulosonate cytidylyltransferase [bacterium]
MENTLGVIPARMSSSRFPGKPLKKILDIPMLGHCYERALLSGACDKLIIATPDQEIIDWANSHYIPSVLTSHSHKRATDRAKETLDILAKRGNLYDLILLLQGDEPQILPQEINNLKDAFSGKESEIVNLVFPIKGYDSEDPNVVKAIVDSNLKINFFSRSNIPNKSTTTFRQLGMIGFTKTALNHYSALLPTPLEELESIDMMRFLENDFCIQGILSSSHTIGVDTPEDIITAEKMMLDDKFIDLYKKKYI